MSEFFEVVLPIPPSVNSMFVNGPNHTRYPSKQYRAWKAEADQHFKLQIGDAPYFTGRLTAEYQFEFQDSRIRDISNFVKPVEDFLVTKRVMVDDEQIDCFIARRIPKGQGSGGVYVRIETMPVTA